ncbi:helix-turn-helix transcriptional regulator [Deinococcus sp.]|uniref:helix-turn-helix domain-containing protein n=1 Tax=Deinococcus sp. TaxID=47478 RepID=UPI0025C58568|nr:helix-turn-helix transcriptional regulator [Deinococcus sp.]
MPTEPRPVSPSRLLFAARVREERQARGWTQEDLGERCDLSWNYVGQVERGTRNISVDNMDAIAQALEMRLADLLLPNPY